jgi:D-alanine-D-alanine ligase
MKYIVLGGGSSPERAVSLRSAAAVGDALSSLGHTPVFLNPAEISADELLGAAQEAAGVFPILHGEGGEDGSVQTLLENHGIPYFGPSATSCKATFNKVAFKELLEKEEIITPQWNIVTTETFPTEPLVKKPFVLKPISGGSSIDTFIVRSLPFKTAPLLEALKNYGSMLIEELIEGSEITVGVLGNEVLPVIEIIPPQDKEFDYENKYNGETQELCPPINVSPAIQQKAQDTALKVHNATHCRHLSRTDMMIDATGQLYVIDTNTIPGLTDQSLFPKAAAQAGYSWEQLVNRFVDMME